MNDALSTPPASDSVSVARARQAFPTLTPEQTECLLRMGERRIWCDSELLFEAGKPGPGMFIVLHGHVAVTRRDGQGNDLPVATQGTGEFLAEVGQPSGKPAFLDGRAVRDLEALLMAPDGLRSGSIKRVAAGGGEGAAVVAQLHVYLAAHVASGRERAMPR